VVLCLLVLEEWLEDDGPPTAERSRRRLLAGRRIVIPLFSSKFRNKMLLHLLHLVLNFPTFIFPGHKRKKIKAKISWNEFSA